MLNEFDLLCVAILKHCLWGIIEIMENPNAAQCHSKLWRFSSAEKPWEQLIWECFQQFVCLNNSH